MYKNVHWCIYTWNQPPAPIASSAPVALWLHYDMIFAVDSCAITALWYCCHVMVLYCLAIAILLALYVDDLYWGALFSVRAIYYSPKGGLRPPLSNRRTPGGWPVHRAALVAREMGVIWGYLGVVGTVFVCFHV